MTASSEPDETVLVPTGRQMKSYGCIRSLNRHGLRTLVASELEWVPHFTSRYCSEQHHLSAGPRTPLAYKDALLGLAARPDVETIVPVRECDAYVFAKYRDEFAEHVSLVAPTLGTLRRAHDRLQLATEAAEAGVPLARTRPLSAVDAPEEDVVVKTRYNLLTGEYVDSMPANQAREVNCVRFFEAGEQLDREALTAVFHHEPIVQEFIPRAKKYLYCGLWDRGTPVATYQHEQIRTKSWVGGGGVYRQSAHSQAVEEAAHDLLSHLDWHGYACIEYRKDARTGEWTFLEVNPRVWLSLPEAVRAGVDFPYYYWLRATGREGPIDPTYDTGIRCHISYGELKHLLSTLHDESPFADPPSFTGRLLEIVVSCVRHPRFDYIRRDDPRFFLNAVRALPGMTTSGHYGSHSPRDPASQLTP